MASGKNSDKRAGNTFAVSESFTVTAHSGCLGTAPNSVESMEAGMAAGAQIVEFDLRYAADGTPVLSHDAPKGECVTLKDAFALLQKYPQIRANVDVKDTAHLECIPPLAAEYGVTEQIFFTGIREEDVSAVREKCPGIPYYLNTDVRLFTDLRALAEKTKTLGAIGVNLNERGASGRLVRVCHARGLLVSVWTVDRPRKARRVLAMHPDNITTRRPDMLCTMICRKSG